MKIKVKVKFFSVLALVAVLASCGDIPVYEKSYTFQNNVWDQNVKPSFAIDIKDITKEYDFILTLRTTTDYKFSNLWIYLNTTTPDGQKAREPFQIHITNPDGSWIGKKTGTVVENELVFKRKKLPVKGKYVFVLEQAITESQIGEVLDVGLMVLEAKGDKK